MVVDRETKMYNLILCIDSITALEVPQYVSNNVAHSIVSDKDVRFISLFWSALGNLLGTKLIMGTAYYRQTSGQVEQ